MQANTWTTNLHVATSFDSSTKRSRPTQRTRSAAGDRKAFELARSPYVVPTHPLGRVVRGRAFVLWRRDLLASIDQLKMTPSAKFRWRPASNVYVGLLLVHCGGLFPRRPAAARAVILHAYTARPGELEAGPRRDSSCHKYNSQQ
eukprot:COSAG06_NODE_2519_length_6729_cov_5.857919_1_plen_145_part_00